MDDRLKSLVLATIADYPEIVFDGMHRTARNLVTEVSLLFRDNTRQLHRLPVLVIDGHDYLVEPSGDRIRAAIRTHVNAFLSSPLRESRAKE